MLSQRDCPCTVAVKTLFSSCNNSISYTAIFYHSLSSTTSKMDSKCCSQCWRKLLLTSFLKNVDADPASRVDSTCITCREKPRKRCAPAIATPQPPAQRPRTVYPLLLLLYKTNRLQASVQCQIAPAIATPQPPAQRPRIATPGPVSPLLLLLYKTNRLQASFQRQILPIPPIQEHQVLPQPQVAQPIPTVLPEPELPQPIPPVLPQTRPHPELPIQPPVAGFLPAEQWEYLQRFHTAMEEVKMETCSRCKESWFAMDLRETVCHRCFLRDKRGQTPWLMSEENNMDPGEVPAYLPELTQIEEMIIARSHVQMMIYRYRGHQYHYTGHCVSFMQNTVKTVDVLPNLPAELDVVVLRPSDGMVQDDLRYQRLRSSKAPRSGPRRAPGGISRVLLFSLYRPSFHLQTRNPWSQI